MWAKLGGKLRAARKDRNLTLREVAAQIGKSKSVVSAYESGSRPPSIATVCALADLYEFPTDRFLNSETLGGGRTRPQEPADESVIDVRRLGSLADSSPQIRPALELVESIQLLRGDLSPILTLRSGDQAFLQLLLKDRLADVFAAPVETKTPRLGSPSPSDHLLASGTNSN